MKKPIKFLRADKIIQLIILAPTIFLGIMGMVVNDLLIFYAIGLFFIGGWQVLSAFILSIGYRDITRIKYLLGVAGYFSFMLIVSQLDTSNIRSIMKGLGMLYLMALPTCIAIWYFFLTRKEANETIESHEEIIDENILDSNDIMAF